jgi:hypothetical protein
VTCVPDGFSLKYSMSNLIGASQCEHGNGAYRRNATFVGGHLGRILLFLSMLHIGRRASENQGSRMKRLHRRKP